MKMLQNTKCHLDTGDAFANPNSDIGGKRQRHLSLKKPY